MNLYLLFAEVLDYPNDSLPQRVEECSLELATAFPEATKLLKSFQRSQQELGITRLQEAYTSTFDLRPECTLNLGYHLFGEDQRCGMFLAKLKELFHEAGVDTGKELPDHLCYLLRYVAARPGSDKSSAIISDCLLPAASKIAQGMNEKSNPYRPVVEALLLWLEGESQSEAVLSGMHIDSSHLSS
jgi:nitrate reductase molybdenum cofactor assembly chaperone NarJ/NarW